MSEQELASTCADVAELITSSGVTAVVLRKSSARKIYGSDEEDYQEVETIPIDLNEEPKEELSGKIDAIGSVLPETSLLLEDRLKIGSRTFRVQTIEKAYFFGRVTHLDLNLVELHGC